MRLRKRKQQPRGRRTWHRRLSTLPQSVARLCSGLPRDTLCIVRYSYSHQSIETGLSYTAKLVVSRLFLPIGTCPPLVYNLAFVFSIHDLTDVCNTPFQISNIVSHSVSTARGPSLSELGGTESSPNSPSNPTSPPAPKPSPPPKKKSKSRLTDTYAASSRPHPYTSMRPIPSHPTR